MSEKLVNGMTAAQEQEWEDRAFEKCEAVNEEFLGHYIEMRMCLRCFKTAPFSILKSRRQIGTLQEIVQRGVCCACGYNHKPRTTPIGNIRYRGKYKNNW